MTNHTYSRGSLIGWLLKIPAIGGSALARGATASGGLSGPQGVPYGRSANQESADEELAEPEFLGNTLRAWEFHPLRIKNLLELNPLKSRFLVRGLTVPDEPRLYSPGIAP